MTNPALLEDVAYLPPEELIQRTYEMDDDCEWVDGKDPNADVLEWVKGVFKDHTGLDPYINEDLDLDLDDDGKIEAVSGIAIHDPEGRIWFANFEWGNEDEWLVFELDEEC